MTFMKVLLIAFSRTLDALGNRTMGYPPSGEAGLEGCPAETPGMQMSNFLIMNESGNVVS